MRKKLDAAFEEVITTVLWRLLRFINLRVMEHEGLEDHVSV